MGDEVAAALLGTGVGFGLTAVGALAKDWWASEKQSQSIRRMLLLEVDSNIEFTKVLLGQLTVESVDKESPRDRAKTLALAFIRFPVPRWSREVWLSQLPVIPAALPKECIQKLFNHHAYIESALAGRGILIDLRAEQEAAFNAHKEGAMVKRFFPPSVFDNNVEARWGECERILARIIELGNPLDIPEPWYSRFM